MDMLRNQIRACARCPLRANVAIQPVPGQGLPTARIMLIKEKITYQEAKMEDNLLYAQKAFIKQLFKNLNVSTDDLYVTSLTKCNCVRGHDTNAKPFKADVIKCIDWLMAEINIVKPKVILSFGVYTTKMLRDQIPQHNFIELPAIDKLFAAGKGRIIKHIKEIAELVNALEVNELRNR